MTTKWFFQKQLADYPLVLFRAAAANFNMPRISPIVQSQMITLYYLDTTLWQHPNWAQAKNTYWTPIITQTEKESYIFYTKTKQTLELKQNCQLMTGKVPQKATTNLLIKN